MGANGIKVLTGNLKPNLGKRDGPPVWKEILVGLQNYFTRLLEEDLKCLIKTLYVHQIPRVCRHVDSSERIVGDLWKRKDGKGVSRDVVGMWLGCWIWGTCWIKISLC